MGQEDQTNQDVVNSQAAVVWKTHNIQKNHYIQIKAAVIHHKTLKILLNHSVPMSAHIL